MIRLATPADLERITHVRTSVLENHLSVEEMSARGITQESVRAEMKSGILAAWVAEANGEVIAFSMANKATARVFALFTLPGYEGRGFGSELLERCEDWLRKNGTRQAGLDTGRNTRALRFYLERGWREDLGASTFEHEVELKKDL